MVIKGSWQSGHSFTRRPQFKSSHQQNFIMNIFTVEKYGLLKMNDSHSGDVEKKRRMLTQPWWKYLANNIFDLNSSPKNQILILFAGIIKDLVWSVHFSDFDHDCGVVKVVENVDDDADIEGGICDLK